MADSKIKAGQSTRKLLPSDSGIDLERLKIVEIGRPYVKCALTQTRCFASRHTGSGTPGELEPLFRLASAIRDPKLDLILCHPQASPFSWRWWLRNFGNRRILRGYLPISSLISPQFLRLKTKAPVAVIDLEDTPFIRREDLFLLDRSVAWFKRELPVDRWQVFMRTDHNSLPTGRYRNSPHARQRIEKLRPISIGVPIGSEGLFPDAPSEKTSDIFFAGVTAGSSFVRQQGIKELKSLACKGVRVDIPSERLSKEEFIQRAAAAKLVWSPEGFGWDCFRHYETPLCWSVPVINQPTIERHQPLLNGIHAYYYDPEQGGLEQVVMRALADPVKLASMAAAARMHVQSHHTNRGLVRHILKELLYRDSLCNP